MRPLALAVALLTLSGLAGVDAQKFRSSTDLVSIYTTVQDQATRLVPDLTQDDFVITDNGKEQPITFFSNEITPFSVVVMLDRSGSIYEHQIRSAAAMASSSACCRTTRRGSGVWRVPGNSVMLESACVHIQQGRPRRRIGTCRSRRQLPVWLAINQSVTALTEQVTRRVVVIFSDGRDQPAPEQALVNVNVKDLIDRVRLANVMVYALAFADVERRNGGVRITPPDPQLRRLADDSGGG